MIKKFINTPETIVKDMIDGFVHAFNDRIYKVAGYNVIARKQKDLKKVGVVIGNGSGHEPACIGFVGDNMLDCNAYGDIFSSPGPDTILKAIEEANTGHGVIVLISNHAGDVINANMAIEWAKEDGIDARSVLLYDDIASAPKDELKVRRGTAGTLFNYKITGSYAAEGHSIEKVLQMAEKVRDRTRTLTIASIPSTSPISGEKMFEIKAGRLEIGMGVHGESAMRSIEMESANHVANIMCDLLIKDRPLQSGDEISVLVNGCGQTTYMELLIFYKEVKNYLEDKGIKVFKPAIGSFITTQEMGGIALSLCQVDADMKRAWEKQTNAISFT